MEDDEFYTAHNTMVQRSRKKDGTIVNTEATITDLGTLVIIDDAEEEDEMDTMKSESPASQSSLIAFTGSHLHRNGHWCGGKGLQV